MAIGILRLRIPHPAFTHDPGSTSLRRGLRAALVMPLTLGTAVLLGVRPPAATFLVFGLIALLVFADFGGTTRSRVTAYLLTALAGIPLVTIGTLASATVWLAIAVSAVVGFVLSGIGVLGGYFLNAQTALMLAFVLAVTTLAPSDVLPPRIIGWTAAGVIAVLAGWLIWPRSSHVALRGLAAQVIRSVATTVAAPPGGGRSVELEVKARQNLASLRQGFLAAQRRPSGATRRDRALAELTTELDRALTFAASAAVTGTSDAATGANTLRTAVMRALRASAALLEGGRDVHDIAELLRARDNHRAALDHWVVDRIQAGATPEFVLDALAAAHPLRVMSMMALAIAQNTEVVAGLPTTGSGPGASRRGVWNTIIEELAPSSIWLRNSLRTALGVAIAVGAARSLAVPYAFWVVLGTLSALRGNISATGRSAMLAMIGTAVGVLIAIPFVGATGSEPWVLWIVFPVLVFLAAYTPAAVSFLVGQVAFSVLVVVLFNILAPSDWQLGLVRIENAALGLAISVVLGLLLWPRGAQGQMRAALADLYDAAASSLSYSFRRALTDANEPVEALNSARDSAHTQAIRAQEVFELFLTERTRQAPAVDVWATLLSSGKGFLLMGDAVDGFVEQGYAAARAGAPASTVASVASMAIADMIRLAEEIRGSKPLRVAEQRETSGELRAAQLASLSEPEAVKSPAGLRSAVALVATADWVAQLDVLLQELEAPVGQTLGRHAKPWWR